MRILIRRLLLPGLGGKRAGAVGRAGRQTDKTDGQTDTLGESRHLAGECSSILSRPTEGHPPVAPVPT